MYDDNCSNRLKLIKKLASPAESIIVGMDTVAPVVTVMPKTTPEANKK